MKNNASHKTFIYSEVWSAPLILNQGTVNQGKCEAGPILIYETKNGRLLSPVNLFLSRR